MLHTAARRDAHVRALAVAAALLALGCRTSPPAPAPSPADDPRFPSREKLSGLPPAAAELPFPAVDDVESWTLAGPFPERVETVAHAPGDAFEGLLEDAVKQRAGLAVAAESLHCAARELGRFLLEREKPPPIPLLEFMAARCGAVGFGFRPAWYHGTVSPDVPDESLLAQWRPQLESLLQASLAGGPSEAGLWFGRDRGRAVVAIVSTQRRVLITPFSPVVSEDGVALGGEALSRASDVIANVNQGELGYAACERDPGVALPRFAFRCPIAAGDPQALIEVGLREPGRVLALGGLRALARRADEPAATWRRRGIDTTPASATPEAFTQALAAAIGRVRSGAELPPLGLSLAQSEQAAELVPHILAGAFGEGSPALADIAVLGLIAGWDVGGPIRDASLASALSPGELDADRWLEIALAGPSGRAALLDPEARVLAIGSLVSNAPPVAGAIAVTYQLFDGLDFEAEAERVVARVTELRAQRGLPAPERLERARPALDDAARALPAGRLAPLAALEAALAGAQHATGLSLQGWVIEASRVDELRLPPELTERESVQLAVAVGYAQAPGDPWGHFVALLATPAPGRGI